MIYISNPKENKNESRRETSCGVYKSSNVATPCLLISFSNNTVVERENGNHVFQRRNAINYLRLVRSINFVDREIPASQLLSHLSNRISRIN